MISGFLLKNFHLIALENGVSQYPKLDGRFPQVSGIEYAFDPSKPSGQRILPTDIKVQNQVLEFNKVKYKNDCLSLKS